MHYTTSFAIILPSYACWLLIQSILLWLYILCFCFFLFSAGQTCNSVIYNVRGLNKHNITWNVTLQLYWEIFVYKEPFLFFLFIFLLQWSDGPRKPPGVLNNFSFISFHWRNPVTRLHWCLGWRKRMRLDEQKMDRCDWRIIHMVWGNTRAEYCYKLLYFSGF